MDIELKNIQHSPSLSEETEAFTANLYINGIHAGYTSNRGHGGSTDYQAVNEKGRELIREAETYCKTLPDVIVPAREGMKEYSYAMDLEYMIDDLLYKHLAQKELVRFNKQLQKATQSGIMYGIPGEYFSGFNYKIPLDTLLKNWKGPGTMKATIINKILPKLKDGVVILNTNIPENILKEAGLKEDQYLKPTPLQKQATAKEIKKPGRKV